MRVGVMQVRANTTTAPLKGAMPSGVLGLGSVPGGKRAPDRPFIITLQSTGLLPSQQLAFELDGAELARHGFQANITTRHEVGAIVPYRATKVSRDTSIVLTKMKPGEQLLGPITFRLLAKTRRLTDQELIARGEDVGGTCKLLNRTVSRERRTTEDRSPLDFDGAGLVLPGEEVGYGSGAGGCTCCWRRVKLVSGRG